MPSPDPFYRSEGLSPRTLRVLASLPAADERRFAQRRRQQRQRLAALWVGTLMLVACLGPETSDLATRALAWLYAADVAWKGLVVAALGQMILLPALSALFLLGLSTLLWYRLLSVQHRGVR